MRHVPSRRVVAFVLLSIALVLATMSVPGVPSAAAAETEIVRRLVYRDLMPSTGDEIIENFAVGGSPILSADGSTAVYSITRPDGPEEAAVAHVYLFDVDSRTATEVDQTDPGPILDVSDDGSRALTAVQSRESGRVVIRVASASGAQTVAEGTEIVEAVLSGDGETVVFSVTRNGALIGVDGEAVAGMYAVDADGGNLRRLVAAEELRDEMDAAPDAAIFMQNYASQIDVSADGQRVVFDTINVSNGEYWAFGIEGGQVQTLGGPYGMLTRLTISGDGSTMLSLTYAFPYDGSKPGEYAISAFDGSGRSIVTTTELTGAVYGKGVMLSHDGSLALIGESGQLYDTASGTAIPLAIGCAALSGAALPRLTMDGTGSRFLYLANDYHAPAPLSLLELDPTDLVAGVPIVSEVTIDPTTLTAGTEQRATVSVRVEADETPAVCLSGLRGVVDESLNGVGLEVGLADDGLIADEAAGDGVYTSAGLRALAGSLGGPRTIRIKAEVIDDDGYRRAMAIDVEPFSVNGVTPDAETPDAETPDAETPDAETPDAETPDAETPDAETPDAETPDAETPDAETPDAETPDAETPDAETPDAETPDDAAGGGSEWSAWVGEPAAADCTVDPLTGEELVDLIVAAAAEPPDASTVPLQVDDADELPAGEPLDDETTAAVLDTVSELAACLNAGDTFRFLTHFTPNGLAALLAYAGLPLTPVSDEERAELEANIEASIGAEPVEVAPEDRSTIEEIRDVRMLEDGRVLVISVGNSQFGEQLGYLVLVEEDGVWLVDSAGVIGEPVEVDLAL